MTDRTRLTISPNSWHYRVYENWHQRKGALPRQLDLCHYVRVLVLLAPWRWFWQREFFGQVWLRPWTLTVGVPALVVLGLLLYWFPLDVATVALLGGAGVFAALSLITFAHLIEESQRAQDVLILATIWLWWPVWKVALGVAVVGRWLVRPLVTVAVGGRGFNVVPLFLLVLLGYGVLVFFLPKVMLGVTLGAIGGVLIITGLVFLSTRAHAWHERRLEARLRETDLTVEPEEPKGPGFLSLAWEWIVAKKHRVCPFIDVAERGHVGLVDGTEWRG